VSQSVDNFADPFRALDVTESSLFSIDVMMSRSRVGEASRFFFTVRCVPVPRQDARYPSFEGFFNQDK
jgi:hypothetical protein